MPARRRSPGARLFATRAAGVEPLEPRLLLAANVVTYHNDAASTGQNLNEKLLTPSSVKVGRFGKQFSTPLDGQAYAQPLYVAGVRVTVGPFKGRHDVVFAATQHDSLYAIDADGGNVLWRTSFIDPAVRGVALRGATSVTTVPTADVGSFDINPQIGITATPTIDLAQNAIFVVTKTKQIVSGTAHYVATLFKVNVRSGAVTASRVIGDTAYVNQRYAYRTAADPAAAQDPFVAGAGEGAIKVNGQRRVYFNALRGLNRAALAMHGGSVFTAWASHGDNGPYHGWILGFDAKTLAPTAVFNTSPNGSGAGIWQSGGPPSIDGQGNFYFETGNGTFDGDKGARGQTTGLNRRGFPARGDYGDTFMKVAADSASTAAKQNVNGWGMKVVDYFAPFNNHDLDRVDRDLGSGAPLLMPDAVGSKAHRHLLIGGGKEGKLYLIDRDDMGKFSPATDRVVQEQTGTLSGVLNTPALFFDGNAYRLYFVPGYNNDHAKAFTIARGRLSDMPASQSGDTYGYLPGSPSVSADGTANGIVWAIDTGSTSLRAYDAADLSKELWTSNQAPGGRDALGQTTKFSTPTVADGEVFVGTAGALVAYGPPTSADAPPAAPTGLAAMPRNFRSVRLTWADASDNEDYFRVLRSTRNGPFVEVGVAGANATSFVDSSGLLADTAYDYRVVAHNRFNAGSDSAPSNAVRVTTPLPPLDGAGDGAAAAYFTDARGRLLSGKPVLTRVDPQIDFDFGDDGPAMAVGDDHFSVRWSGRIRAPRSEAYTFSTATDAGVRLYLKPAGATTWTTLIDHWTAHTLARDAGRFTLSAGQFYDFKMEYYEDAGPAAARLFWASASTPRQAIPTSQLYSGTAPAAPDRLRVTAASGTQLNLTWRDNATNEAGYLIRRTNPDGSVTDIRVAANAHAYVDAGRTPDTVYRYAVRATNFAANSGFTRQVAATTPVAPPTPSGAHVTAVTPTNVGLAWRLNSTKPSDRETGITISRKKGAGGFFQVIAELPPGTTTFVDRGPGGEGLTPGTFYDYHVQARNAAGYSDFTGTNVTTPAGA